MEALPVPSKTAIAIRRLARPSTTYDRLMEALMSNVDGHRNVIELESFARAMGLHEDALESLRRQGLIERAGGSQN